MTLAVGALALRFFSDVEPLTVHTFLPARSVTDLIVVLSALTMMSCLATKYGPAKSTTCLRASLIVYVATTKSTVPFWMNGSRFSDTDSTNSIFTFGPMAATIALRDLDVEALDGASGRVLQTEAGLVELHADLDACRPCWIRAMVVPAANV